MNDKIYCSTDKFPQFVSDNLICAERAMISIMLMLIYITLHNTTLTYY